MNNLTDCTNMRLWRSGAIDSRLALVVLALTSVVLSSETLSSETTSSGTWAKKIQELDRPGVSSNAASAQDPTELARQNDSWRQMVAELQSPEFARRDLASKKLWATDFPAMVQVLPLLTADDAEVAWRAKEVMIQQGVRGSSDVVRRIGLLLRLLTAAGHQEFAEDAEKFESRIAALRVADAVRKLESIEGVSVIPGPMVGGMMVGGNVLRFQGGVVIGQAQIEVGPRIVFPGDQIEILEVPPKVADGVQEKPGQVPPVPTEDEAATDSGQSEPAGAADASIRQAYLNENLGTWLEQCVTASSEELAALEQSWQAMGLIDVSTQSTEQVAQYFDLTITKTLDDQQVLILKDFFQSPVSVVLNMVEVDMSPELQKLLVESAHAGKFQYLNTLKCGYNLETCKALMQALKEGRLGYWQAQGRAMLGIKGPSQLLREDYSNRGGALVGEVTRGSSAELGGMLANDVIRRINDMPIENFDELRRVVAAFGVGDKIKVEITRGADDQPQTLEFELMESTQ